MIHKRLIGIGWIVIGALILSTLVLGAESSSLLKGIPMSLLFLSAGFAMFANYRNTSWLCLPCSALSLFTFPVGTVLGVYYLWYFIVIERPARS